MAEIAKVVDHREARLDLLVADAGQRHKGPVFGIDIVPGDAAGRRSFWLKYGARAGAAVGCLYRYRGTLPIARGVGRGRSHPDLVDQPMDHRVADLLGGCVNPGEVSVGSP